MSSTVTALLAGRATSFASGLEEGRTDRHPVTALTLTVPLTHDDVEAVLWWVVQHGARLDELADLDAALSYLCDALAHAATSEFDQARHTLAGLAPGSDEHCVYQRLRAVAERLIGPRPVVAAPRGGVGQLAAAGSGRRADRPGQHDRQETIGVSPDRVYSDQRYSVRSLARLLHLSTSMIHRAISSGALAADHYRVGGRSVVMVPGSAVLAWAFRDSSTVGEA